MSQGEGREPEVWLERIFMERDRWPLQRSLSSSVLAALSETRSAIPGDVKTVLDAGCGDGRFANRVAKVFEVTALDYSVAALLQVQVPKVCGDLTRLPFANGSFDLALCSQVLEHLPDTMFGVALAELKRVARKYVLVTVPNYEKDYSDIRARSVKCPECKRVFHLDGHVRPFTSRSLRRMFRTYGIPGTACVDVRPIALRRVRRLPRLGPLRWYLEPESWGYWRSGQKCPFCGYESNGLKGSGFFLSAWRRAARFLHFILCPAKLEEYRWLLALYTVDR